MYMLRLIRQTQNKEAFLSMTSNLLNAFYNCVQKNLGITQYGTFTSNRDLQQSITLEKWEEARQSLHALKGAPIECKPDDVQKLINFINAANAIGLTCRFINSSDITDADKSRAFDKSGLELHVRF